MVIASVPFRVLNEHVNIRDWLEAYFERYRRALVTSGVCATVIALTNLAVAIGSAGGQAFFAGNGGSAAIASHAAVDFTAQAGVRGPTFNEGDLITCFANDFGYEHWMANGIEFLRQAGRRRRAHQLRRNVAERRSCRGTSPLNQMGDVIFWLYSRAYNIIECVRMSCKTTVVDHIIGKARYPVT